MNASDMLVAGRGHSPETFSAELTEAVFPVALRYGVGDRWLDLELDLWHMLAETAERWRRLWPDGGSPREFEVLRTCLLAALAGAAYHTALRHGARASVPHSRAGLYQAFHSAIGESVRSFGRVPA